MSTAHPCPFCGSSLPSEFRSEVDGRLAYDPWKGRLWSVCRVCLRWTPAPLEERWETLEACERAVAREGKQLLSSAHLALVDVGERQLIRVGRPPRIEFAGWRYGDRAAARARQGLFRALLQGLPPPPPHGYRPYGLGRADPPAHWVLSPFQDAAWALTTAFTTVPLAPRCPACSLPVALRPWQFHELRLVRSEGVARFLAPCALCDSNVTLPIAVARPAVRLGLSVVDPPRMGTTRAEAAAAELDRAGGAEGFVDLLADESLALGEADADERLALVMALDEQAELEALEREWREAEEIAGIMDGELTQVPGFEAFRESVLALTRGSGF